MTMPGCAEFVDKDYEKLSRPAPQPGNYEISYMMRDSTRPRLVTPAGRKREKVLFKTLNHQRNILALAKTTMDSKQYEEIEKRLNRKAWTMTGRIKYLFPMENLNAVMKMHEKIGTVPKGFYYPELHKQRSGPFEMPGFQ